MGSGHPCHNSIQFFFTELLLVEEARLDQPGLLFPSNSLLLFVNLTLMLMLFLRYRPKTATPAG